MHIDKEDAIALADRAKKVIEQFCELIPADPARKNRIPIVDLEYLLEKLDKAIEDSPTK